MPRPFNFFDSYSEGLARGAFDFGAGGLRVYFTDTAPDAASDEEEGDLAGISAGNGYPGPLNPNSSVSRSGPVTSVSGSTVSFTADGGSVGPFRYAVFMDTSGAGNPLVGWWDYEDSVTVQNGESFAVEFPEAQLTFTPSA